MKAAIIAGCVLFLVQCAAPGAHAGYFGNEKWTENDRYCVVEKLTAPSTPGSENESGGQEFESLRARHEINNLAYHDLPEKRPG